jgi:hypothetical protein
MVCVPGKNYEERASERERATFLIYKQNTTKAVNICQSTTVLFEKIEFPSFALFLSLFLLVVIMYMSANFPLSLSLILPPAHRCDVMPGEFRISFFDGVL